MQPALWRYLAKPHGPAGPLTRWKLVKSLLHSFAAIDLARGLAVTAMPQSSRIWRSQTIIYR